MKIFKLIISIFVLGIFTSPILASETIGTISEENKYAWSEKIGWINFNPVNGNVKITDSGISGYAWSSNYGWINLSPTNSGVKNDGKGNLSGYAWNDTLGWVSFSGLTIDQHGRILGITDSTDSEFGRIVFTCPNCLVTTNWRPESTWAQTTTSSTVDTLKQTETNDSDENIEKYIQKVLEISLDLNKAKVRKITELVAKVSISNNSSETIPLVLTFSILDTNNKNVYISVEELEVQKQKDFEKEFKQAPNLENGKYLLVLDSLYNDSVTDKLELEFEVDSNSFNFNWWIIIAL